VRILPISEKYGDYAYEVAAELKRNGVLVHVDNRSEKIGYKIRDARNNRVPYMLVLGQQEEETRTVAVRSRFAGDEGVKPIADFVAQICEEIRTKRIRKVEVSE
jgi:threonyl-tRNA synthetase